MEGSDGPSLVELGKVSIAKRIQIRKFADEMNSKIGKRNSFYTEKQNVKDLSRRSEC